MIPARTRSAKQPRNLVVCCDGTGNEIGSQLSNVLKLYRISVKDAAQLVYYDPGIGTLSMPSTFGRLQQKAKGVFGMATGWGMDDDVLDAYRFLCENYVDGDAIYLFGFSRGAHTVRVLAGLIQLIGLLRADQVNFAGYALRAYKQAAEQDDLDIAWQFRRVINGIPAPIHFMGVWDTVASVITPGRTVLSPLQLESLPYTKTNPSVRCFRHAMAIDEFRRMFRLRPWVEPQVFKPNPFAKVSQPPAQDSLQVWFAGCHSDIGGGYVEEESSLSKIPLKWMIDEARAQGLRIQTAMYNHIVLGRPRKNARTYQRPDPLGQLHASATGGWRLLEWLPKSVRYREWLRRKSLLGAYVPMAEPRPIPSGANVHSSVVVRLKSDLSYRPVNLPGSYVIV